MVNNTIKFLEKREQLEKAVISDLGKFAEKVEKYALQDKSVMADLADITAKTTVHARNLKEECDKMKNEQKLLEKYL